MQSRNTSVTFSSNLGSLEMVKDFTRWGLKLASRQIRCTLVWLISMAFAIDRDDHCVACGGTSVVVFDRTFALI